MPIKKKINKKLIIENFFRFIENLAMIFAFQALFGAVNILPAIAISVGFTMFPIYEHGIRPKTMCFIITFLYTMSGICAQTALISPWFAFPINFAFVVVTILMTHEPHTMKPSVTFLLCFVFAQSTPVPWAAFYSRFLCCFLGGLFVGLSTWIWWKYKGYGKDGRTLKEQMRLCNKNHRYMFRMSFGIAFAMLLAALLGLKKPLWISIVVMSLTQLEFEETLERIKHRFVGTLLGVALFFVFFQLLIPREYAAYVILAMGYISFFMPEYKYKQIINAISALNASLVLLDTKTAIENRLLCLAGGIAIVIAIYVIAEYSKKFKEVLLKKQNILKVD